MFKAFMELLRYMTGFTGEQRFSLPRATPSHRIPSGSVLIQAVHFIVVLSMAAYGTRSLPRPGNLRHFDTLLRNYAILTAGEEQTLKFMAGADCSCNSCRAQGHNKMGPLYYLPTKAYLLQLTMFFRSTVQSEPKRIFRFCSLTFIL
jgi:hypothetical protein